MKFLTNYKYWVANFIGWILFALLMLTLDKISYGGDMPINRIHYLLSEGVLCGFLGFILSFIILYFIENYFDIGNYSKNDIHFGPSWPGWLGYVCQFPSIALPLLR